VCLSAVSSLCDRPNGSFLVGSLAGNSVDKSGSHERSTGRRTNTTFWAARRGSVHFNLCTLQHKQGGFWAVSARIGPELLAATDSLSGSAQRETVRWHFLSEPPFPACGIGHHDKNRSAVFGVLVKVWTARRAGVFRRHLNRARFRGKSGALSPQQDESKG